MDNSINLFTAFAQVLIVLFIVYGIVWIWILPMNRVRPLSDNVGFAHINGGDQKRDVVNRLRKTRFQGKIPPAFPNGWYALVESKKVLLYLHQYFNLLICPSGVQSHHFTNFYESNKSCSNTLH